MPADNRTQITIAIIAAVAAIVAAVIPSLINSDPDPVSPSNNSNTVINSPTTPIAIASPAVSANRIRLTELECLNPQSGFPKKCDEIYLTVNGNKLWSGNVKRICKGNKIFLNDIISLKDDVTITLWESDENADDNLGSVIVAADKIAKQDQLSISGHTVLGKWHYTLKYKKLHNASN